MSMRTCGYADTRCADTFKPPPKRPRAAERLKNEAQGVSPGISPQGTKPGGAKEKPASSQKPEARS